MTLSRINMFLCHWLQLKMMKRSNDIMLSLRSNFLRNVICSLPKSTLFLRVSVNRVCDVLDQLFVMSMCQSVLQRSWLRLRADLRSCKIKFTSIKNHFPNRNMEAPLTGSCVVVQQRPVYFVLGRWVCWRHLHSFYTFLKCWADAEHTLKILHCAVAGENWNDQLERSEVGFHRILPKSCFASKLSGVRLSICF